MPTVVFVALFFAFFFAFWNGFTDAAYAISTVVATRVLSPAKAVLLSAVGNFTGLLFGTAVAETIGKGIVENYVIDGKFILAVLIGGLLWDVSTWFFALPISESHVLVGALIGAGLVAGGVAAVQFSSIIDKVLIPMITSPLIAFIIAFFLVGAVIRIFARYSSRKTNRLFRNLQLLSSFSFSVSHGTNDAQKAMGIITILLYKYGYLGEFSVPLWVMLSLSRFLCRGKRSLGSFRNGFNWSSGFNDSRYFRSHYGSGDDQKSFGSPLGNGEKNCLGLDFNHASFSYFCWVGLFFNYKVSLI